jgi:hypothetical protein
MRGTSSPDDKLAGDLGNEIEGIESAVTGQIFFKAENWRREIWDFFDSIAQNEKPPFSGLCRLPPAADITP